MRSGYEMMCPGDKLRSSSAHDEAAENEVVEAGTSRQYGAELQSYRTMKCSACVVVGALMGKLVAADSIQRMPLPPRHADEQSRNRPLSAATY